MPEKITKKSQPWKKKPAREKNRQWHSWKEKGAIKWKTGADFGNDVENIVKLKSTSRTDQNQNYVRWEANLKTKYETKSKAQNPEKLKIPCRNSILQLYFEVPLSELNHDLVRVRNCIPPVQKLQKSTREKNGKYIKTRRRQKKNGREKTQKSRRKLACSENSAHGKIRKRDKKGLHEHFWD